MRHSVFALGALSVACGGWDALPSEEEPLPPPPPAIHVEGNRIIGSDGSPLVLHGVNRSGTEYRCIQANDMTSPEHYFFDGPGDAASIEVMRSWNINAVRVPLNETCWLGINGALPEASGPYYQAAIRDYVNLLHQAGLVPILELHWAAPGAVQARRLQPMPNRDHTPDFWRSVAELFRDDELVVFEVYNEPFPYRNSDSDAAWDCWQNGCTEDTMVRAGSGEASVAYEAAGMQELVDAVRETGNRNLLLVGGVQYSNSLSQWLKRKPQDPIGNTAASWHVYDNNACKDEACWTSDPASVAEQIPLVATEIGQGDCGASEFVAPLLDFLDEHANGYLAWSWNAYGECLPQGSMPRANPWSLVTDYVSGTPNGGYAEIFYDHLEALR